MALQLHNVLTLIRCYTMFSTLLTFQLPEECRRINNLKHADLIVSLTSYPPRFSTLHKTIESILKQSITPQRFCLYIAENDMEQLPDKVTRLAGYGLEIVPTKDIRSFKKLIPCLSSNRDQVIVTADDDVVYPRHWLRLLYWHHLETPSTIICHRARYMTFSSTGSINSYIWWPNIDRELASLLVVPIGNGGVLYPPDCFHEEIDKEDLFLHLCGSSDDIWFKAMSLKRRIACKKINHYPHFFKHHRKSQQTALKNTNMQFLNDEHITKVFNQFNILETLRQAESGG